jgi:hypothetical protein
LIFRDYCFHCLSENRLITGKAKAKILSLPDASSMGVCRIEGAGRLGGFGIAAGNLLQDLFTAVVGMLRFGTID